MISAFACLSSPGEVGRKSFCPSGKIEQAQTQTHAQTQTQTKAEAEAEALQVIRRVTNLLFMAVEFL